MLALGHYGKESQAVNTSGLIAETCGDEKHLSSGHPEIHAALTAAVFREHSQAFVDLSMHEQRLYRILRDASKSFEDMKAKRIAARQADLDAAVALSNLNKMLGVPHEPSSAGFVFKPEEIETERRRHRHLLEAKIAQERPQEVPPNSRHRPMTSQNTNGSSQFFSAETLRLCVTNGFSPGCAVPL